MDAELFNDWFHVADTDHNGVRPSPCFMSLHAFTIRPHEGKPSIRHQVISGAEAVEFFQRSNLSQDTLFQVHLAPGTRPLTQAFHLAPN